MNLWGPFPYKPPQQRIHNKKDINYEFKHENDTVEEWNKTEQVWGFCLFFCEQMKFALPHIILGKDWDGSFIMSWGGAKLFLVFG